VPVLSNAAAFSAARALSNLAGAAARAASARTSPPAGDGAARTTLVTVDPDGFDRRGPVPDVPDFDMAPGTGDEASAGTDAGAEGSEVPQADPHLDDILPAKSKSFFRLHR
jgi:hypothetical protein